MALIGATDLVGTGVGPSESINDGGMVRPDGEMHFMTIINSRLSD